MVNTDTELVRGLPEEQAAAVSALGQPLVLQAGGVLFKPGDTADRLYHVVRGSIALTLPMLVRGKRQDVLVEERSPGDTLGWSGLIPPHRFTLQARSPGESELLAFSRDALLRHFAEHPAVGTVVTRNVAAVIGHRLQVFQAMWTREMQRVIDSRYA